MATILTFDKAMDRLLDQVFDEYGLIICGWSGEYDIALRKAVERSKTRRYPMYWTGLSEPHGATKNLIALHGVHFLKIGSADSFFASLLEKVEALEEFERPHPISTQAAIVTLKRYLSEDKYRIPLRDFLVSEAKDTRSAIDAGFAHIQGTPPDQQSTRDLMTRLEAGCEKLVHLFANGSFYATADHAKSFFDAFHLVLVKAQSSDGYTVWNNLRKYPALLLVYASGIATIASESYAVLRELALRPSFIKHEEDKSVPAPVRVYTHSAMERDLARQLIAGRERGKTPVSDHLFDHLREVLSVLIPDDAQYEQAFDNFEYLWCLLHVDAEKQRGSSHVWTPYGSFVWRWERYGGGDRFSGQAQKAIDDGDANWTPIKSGLFGGNIERLKIAKKHADDLLEKMMFS